MRRNKSLTVARSSYYSSLASSTGKLPSRAAAEYSEYKAVSSLTQDLASILNKGKSSSSSRSLRSSQRIVPSFSSTSTPRGEIRIGSHSAKASSLRSAYGGTPSSRSRGTFAFPKEEDHAKPATAWLGSSTGSKEVAISKLKSEGSSKPSRPATGRQQVGQYNIQSPKSRPLLQSPKSRGGVSPSNVLFKKASRLGKKQVTAPLNTVVTKVAQTQRQSNVELDHEDQQARSERIYREHLFQTFNALKCVRSLPPPNPTQLKQKRVTLTKRPGYTNKKTIIFDLDETLVHCNDDLNSSDVVLPVRFPTGELISVRCN